MGGGGGARKCTCRMESSREGVCGRVHTLGFVETLLGHTWG